MTTKQFLDKALPKCSNLNEAVKEMIYQANIDAEQMVKDDILNRLSNSDKEYLKANPNVQIIPHPCYIGFGPSHVVLRKR